ncbi:DUF4309 domain-containing protein [Proteiniborus sp. MB09-C3]|uniref:DUF4309 domain-containing protein n=1 Tax=Proteiniborus sp. MB09-C3 TaxID=3050072 RepID=UPI00255695A8|nr:DUF4309 domain-containing protein [Proteiniborus sp. MB09-C3]WIV12753.1 DUF4309 domain-containing protein [Proteiniborus sp. MB09-C3]
MGKKIIMIFIVLGLLTITACDRNAYKKDDNKKEVENEINKQNEDEAKSSNDDKIDGDHEGKNPDADEDDNETSGDVTLITHENNPLLELALQGKVDGIDFGIGASTDKIIEEWGLPDEYDYFLGGLYFRYDDKNILFLTDAEKDDEEIIHGEVKCIGIFEENKEVFNVKIGMTFDEIISILGEPTYVNTFEQNEESELLAGSWTIVYDTGEYEIVFASNAEKGPVDVVYFWGKN